MKTVSEIAKAIAEYENKTGEKFSPKQMEDFLGVSRATSYRILSGEADIERYANTLAELLQCDPHELLPETESFETNENHHEIPLSKSNRLFRMDSIYRAFLVIKKGSTLTWFLDKNRESSRLRWHRSEEDLRRPLLEGRTLIGRAPELKRFDEIAFSEKITFDGDHTISRLAFDLTFSAEQNWICLYVIGKENNIRVFHQSSTPGKGEWVLYTPNQTVVLQNGDIICFGRYRYINIEISSDEK